MLQPKKKKNRNRLNKSGIIRSRWDVRAKAVLALEFQEYIKRKECPKTDSITKVKDRYPQHFQKYTVAQMKTQICNFSKKV